MNFPSENIGSKLPSLFWAITYLTHKICPLYLRFSRDRVAHLLKGVLVFALFPVWASIGIQKAVAESTLDKIYTAPIGKANSSLQFGIRKSLVVHRGWDWYCSSYKASLVFGRCGVRGNGSARDFDTRMIRSGNESINACRSNVSRVNYVYLNESALRGFSDGNVGKQNSGFSRSKFLSRECERIVSRQSGTRRSIGRLYRSIRSSDSFEPLLTSIVDSEYQQNQRSDRHQENWPIPNDVHPKWAGVVGAVLGFFCILLCVVGLWLVNAAGPVQDISGRNLFKVTLGGLIMLTSLFGFHIALNILDSI